MNEKGLTSRLLYWQLLADNSWPRIRNEE